MAVWLTSTKKGSAVTASKIKPAPKKAVAAYKPGPGGKAVTGTAPVGTPTSGAGAPAGVVGAPSSTGVLGRPVDPFYDAAIAAAQRNYAQAAQQAQYQEGQLGSVFGFGMRPDGGVYDDPSNPFSRAAALHAAFTNSQRGLGTSYAAQGQLYSGALQRAKNEGVRSNEESRDRLIREFQSAYQGIQQSKLAASNALEDSATAADEASINRALAERPDPASVPQADTSAAASAPKAGFKFVMNSGPRAGQSYNLVPGKGPQKGKLVRQYEDGYREAR